MKHPRLALLAAFCALAAAGCSRVKTPDKTPDKSPDKAPESASDKPTDAPDGKPGAAASAATEAGTATTASGLQYSIITPGKGDKHPKRGEKVKVHYTGWLTNGTKFDSSRDRGEPSDFVIGQVVEGWNEALQLMTVGAKWKLTIPGNLGYGPQGNPAAGIAPNATLVFEVELLEFQSLPDFHAPDPTAQKKTDSGLKYEVVTEGKGGSPGPDDALELKYALWNVKGELLECSERAGNPIKARCQDLPPLAFLKEAVGLMRAGARYRFEVAPELCFGAQAQGPALPANSTTVWELELVRVIPPLPVPPFALPEEAKTVTTASGLKYEVIEPGDGVSPKLSDKVKVHYAGWLNDGTLFDSSFQRGEEAVFPAGAVIPGWREGLQLMKPGAVFRFVIPPELAYGPRPAGPKIPANSTLVFWVKLVRIVD